MSLDTEPISLGECWTPLLPAPCFGEKIGLPHIWIKDESQNPTGSFKARGMTAAVSMAKALGINPQAGSSGPGFGAAAAGDVVG